MKVIIAWPISNKVVEVFEKTLPGGFSWINTRFSFDTELLLPNTYHMLVDRDVICIKTLTINFAIDWN